VAFAWDIALIALFAAMVPNALVEGGILVPRAWIGPEFGLLLAVALTGSALGARRPLPSLAVGAALAVCLAALALSVSMTLETTRDPSSWRLDSPPTTVPWVVQCMSDYYSAASPAAIPSTRRGSTHGDPDRARTQRLGPQGIDLAITGVSARVADERTFTRIASA
jgi:hypothetical protein